MASKELSGIVQRIKNAQEHIVRAADAGVYAAGNIIMSDSIPRVPVDFGDLRGSAYVTLPDANGEVEIGYGGSAKEYAVPVHERGPDEVHHEVGEYKYLEKAMIAKESNAKAAIQRKIREATKDPSKKFRLTEQHSKAPK